MNKKKFDLILATEQLGDITRSPLGIPHSFAGSGGTVWVGYPIDNIMGVALVDIMNSIDSYTRFARLDTMGKTFQYNDRYKIIGLPVSRQSHEEFITKVLNQDDNSSSVWGKLKAKLKSFIK